MMLLINKFKVVANQNVFEIINIRFLDVLPMVYTILVLRITARVIVKIGL